MTMLSYNVIDDVVREILCTQEVARKKQEKKIIKKKILTKSMVIRDFANHQKDSDEIYGDSRLRESPKIKKKILTKSMVIRDFANHQ